MAEQEHRVLDFITRFPGRDDDEIAAVLRITPRQSVNMICRRLANRGAIRRDKLPGRKILNYPAGLLSDTESVRARAVEPDGDGEVALKPSRPRLSVSRLSEGGFARAGEWVLEGGVFVRPGQSLPRERGVYAFCMDGLAQYVGVASMGLSKRLYFYSKPGATQRTSQRINEILRAELSRGGAIEIYTASPDDMLWNGLPVNGSAGLEIGLIENFHLPWNIRGARPKQV